MKNRSYLFLSLIITLTYLATLPLNGQGCVAIRGNGGCGLHAIGTPLPAAHDINILGSMRYFKSFRHFRGSHEEVHRIEEGTQVINNSYFFDLSVNYGINDRLFATAILPFVFHDRSSMYEHGGNPPNGLGERHTTTSSGIGDVRLALSYWLFAPMKHNFNYAVGLGIKLPTGDYQASDLFYNQGEDRNEDVYKVVDQSIQPGDGGTGMTLDIQGFHVLGSKFVLNTNLYYLFNVRETNGVLTRNGSSEFSCPDQYAVRIGGFYNLASGVGLYLGSRLEGVPSEDLIGGSSGYRRPGYALSVEPGISYTRNNWSIFASVPVAAYRNRTQSFLDKERTQSTGVYRHGDAAFADYLLNLTVSYNINTVKSH